MLDNKAQSLVIFVLCLPFVLLLLTYVVDITRVNYEKNKMENIVEISKEEETSKICSLIVKNDNNIDCTIESNTIKLNKRIKSLFGIVVGKNYYDIKVSVKI